MAYEIKYTTYKGLPFSCTIYPRKLVLDKSPVYKEPQLMLSVEGTYKEKWLKTLIPLRDILEFNNKSIEEVQVIRPLSNKATYNEYMLNIFIDSQENVIGMEMSM